MKRNRWKKRLIKKETLAGISGEPAEKMRVIAPMQAETRSSSASWRRARNPVRDREYENAPKNFLFPNETPSCTRTPKGW
jgi:hypothetical protein